MDSIRKRKASTATPFANEGVAVKKLKLLNSNSSATTKPRIGEVANKILDQIKRATDKYGRAIADEFLELPPREDLPDYYDFVKLPLAIDTIEAKLKRNEYPSVTTLESDLKRMVQNAKDYNDPQSQIHSDAEKIRRLVSTFMKQHNPAYTEQPGYTAFPTPIPEDSRSVSVAADQVSEPADAKPSIARSETPKKAKVAVDTGGKDDEEEEESREDEEAEEEDTDQVDLDLSGKSFQEAQQAMITYMLQYTDDEGLEIYTPFANLPSRKLEDYYKFTRHPVSLNIVAKRTRGQHGRAPPTGITDFKTWDAFADEISFIWRNAKSYNEDGSEMYNLAADFEEHFKTLLEDARTKVEEPAALRLKLAAPKPKVTLNLASHRSPPQPAAASASTAPGVKIDNESLQRQQQMVQAGVNGQPKAPTPSTPAPAASVPVTNGVRPTSSTNSGSPSAESIKVEKAATQSPAINGTISTQAPVVNGIMPPPLTRPLSGSPLPTGSALFNTFQHPSALLPPTPWRSYPLESALLPSITITTHPHLKIPTPYVLIIPPHTTLAQQSLTVTLPNTHYYLQISPTICKPLSMGRPYKMFVSLNGARLSQRDTQFHADSGKRTHVYEGTLAPGVNRIEVEVAAAAVAASSPAATATNNTDKSSSLTTSSSSAGSPKEDSVIVSSTSSAPAAMGISGTEKMAAKGLDIEKVTVFAHLLRP